MRSILNALQEGRLFELPEPGGKPRSLGFLARILDANPDIEVGTDTIEEIQKREEECNTGIGLGVAVPHVRAKREEGELYCAIGWSAQGLDYGASDGKKVHLVVMYYIPGAQKNVYLKEISSLFKAIRKSGGMEPIATAPDLTTVRNLLLDWISMVAGESGPEQVARMIKLDLKQTQAVAPSTPPAEVAAPAATAAPEPSSPVSGVPGLLGTAHVTPFSVLAVPAAAPLVLSQDAEWGALVEKEANLEARLAANTPFMAGNRHVFVTGSSRYAGGRTLYYCVGVVLTP